MSKFDVFPAACAILFARQLLCANPSVPVPLDQVIHSYVQAIGGEAALDRVTTREVHAARHHGPKIIYYWQKPDSILLIEGKARIGWAGGSGWVLSSKKRVSKLSKGSQRPLQIDANPLRYAQLKQLYPEAEAAPGEQLEGHNMNVVQVANDRGLTKLYFDNSTHLLRRIEETGDSSAYFKHVTDFLNYQDVDGLQFPFRIIHSSNEPNAKPDDVRISKVLQNIPLKPGLFVKPTSSSVVLGGKR